ncbi:MAG: hypothetical protein M3Q75_06170 [Gemmatimonadota bacterium]|nr:hypothetical protein [Gemmatimonadota bacterium]
MPNRSSTLVTCDIVGRLHRIVTPATVLRWQLRLATPDTAATERALSSCALTVHVSTKLTQPGVVVVHQPTPGSDPALERITSQALETLTTATDARGRRVPMVLLPEPTTVRVTDPALLDTFRCRLCQLLRRQRSGPHPATERSRQGGAAFLKAHHLARLYRRRHP